MHDEMETVRQEDRGNLEMGHHLKVPYLSSTLNPTWLPLVFQPTGSLTFILSPTFLLFLLSFLLHYTYLSTFSNFSF